MSDLGVFTLWMVVAMLVPTKTAGLTVTASAKNQLHVFTDKNSKLASQQFDGIWNFAKVFTVNDDSAVIGLGAQNDGSMPVLLAEVGDDVVTDSSWRCTGQNMQGNSDWLQSDFDDSSWTTPNELPYNDGTAPIGFPSDTTAKQITIGSGSPHMYCRKVLASPSDQVSPPNEDTSPPNADPCDTSPCNAGTCTPDDSPAGFTCDCEGTPFTGTLCDHEILANPCEGAGDLHCFTCHASTDVGCWTYGRLQKCSSGQVCGHKKITKPGSGGSTRTSHWRGCIAADHCTVNGEYAIGEHNYKCDDIGQPGYPENMCINCDYGPTEPEAPQKRTYDCSPPTVGTCSCKGDPECKTPDGTYVPQLSGACVYSLIENNCVDGQPFSTPSYKVTVDLEYGNAAKTKVFVSAVHIRVSAGTLVLTRNSLAATWNGQEEDISEANVDSPKHFVGTSVTLVNIAGQARVFLPEDVELEWDYKKQVAVHLPRSQQNSVCGICGNFNGDPEDDLRINNLFYDESCPYNLPPGFAPGDIVDPGAYEVLTRSWFNAKSPGDSSCENECSGAA